MVRLWTVPPWPWPHHHGSALINQLWSKGLVIKRGKEKSLYLIKLDSRPNIFILPSSLIVASRRIAWEVESGKRTMVMRCNNIENANGPPCCIVITRIWIKAPIYSFLAPVCCMRVVTPGAWDYKTRGRRGGSFIMGSILNREKEKGLTKTQFRIRVIEESVNLSPSTKCPCGQSFFLPPGLIFSSSSSLKRRVQTKHPALWRERWA